MTWSKHHNGSLRLQGWDYSNPGFYFITICVHNKEHTLGKVKNNQFLRNEYADIVTGKWKELPGFYDNINLDEFQIMPDHVHMIIEIKGISWAKFSCYFLPNALDEVKGSRDVEYMKKRRKMLIPKIMGRLQMQTSKDINILRQTPGTRFWQPNYFDHIIRNINELDAVRAYIRNNPRNWDGKSIW